MSNPTPPPNYFPYSSSHPVQPFAPPTGVQPSWPSSYSYPTGWMPFPLTSSNPIQAGLNTTEGTALPLDPRVFSQDSSPLRPDRDCQPYSSPMGPMYQIGQHPYTQSPPQLVPKLEPLQFTPIRAPAQPRATGRERPSNEYLAEMFPNSHHIKSLPLRDHLNYPQIQFWTSRKFASYKKRLSEQADLDTNNERRLRKPDDPAGRDYAHLQLKDGNCLLDKDAEPVRDHIKKLFNRIEDLQPGLLGPTYKRTPSFIREAIERDVALRFEFFQYCANGWKVSTSMSALFSNWFRPLRKRRRAQLAAALEGTTSSTTLSIADKTGTKRKRAEAIEVEVDSDKEDQDSERDDQEVRRNIRAKKSKGPTFHVLRRGHAEKNPSLLADKTTHLATESDQSGLPPTLQVNSALEPTRTSSNNVRIEGNLEEVNTNDTLEYRDPVSQNRAAVAVTNSSLEYISAPPTLPSEHLTELPAPSESAPITIPHTTSAPTTHAAKLPTASTLKPVTPENIDQPREQAPSTEQQQQIRGLGQLGQDFVACAVQQPRSTETGSKAPNEAKATGKSKAKSTLKPRGTNTPRDIAMITFIKNHPDATKAEFDQWWKSIEADKSSDEYKKYKRDSDVACSTSGMKKIGNATQEHNEDTSGDAN
ncbi:hypothetical protein BDN72DRAFT_906250 [Pluteus cervinus]|uniref:Uncharacterized protein n=1 Tax=Pluteus cervinus TaxID=181527 RepID=A0ACD2ZZW4_9AGAR|nr:hypothetical protein BDN72DRAFT_906250 [Pluteus cervinus]